MMTLSKVRALARRGAIQFGGTAVTTSAFGLSVHDVIHALSHATAVESARVHAIVVGPTLDGVELRVLAKITDDIYVFGYET